MSMATFTVAQHLPHTSKKAKEARRKKLPDSEPKPAKIRPMRVEMYCIYWNRWLGNNSPRSNP